MAILVDLEAVTVRRSDRTLFDGLSLTVSDGDRVGIVGINGAGKSTLLRIVAGEENPDEGTVRRGSAASVGYLEQVPRLPPGTVGEAAGAGWEARAVLDRLGMGPFAEVDCDVLSGGQRKRVALAAILARSPDLLIVDEPTNHLDIPTVVWLQERLLEWRGGIVIVSHDRHLLDKVCTKMVELDRGHAYYHDGSYSAYLESRAAREERAASAEATRRNLARRELDWLRRGAPARSRKPQARIDAAVELITTRPEAAARSSKLGLALGTPRLGTKVAACENVSFSYDPQGPAVLRNVTFSIGPGERLGVVGANGSGKTTLLELIAGLRTPSAGRIETGPTVYVGYYSQTGSNLDAQARVRDLVAGEFRAPGSPEDNLLMESFWFTGELPFAPVGTLSGGERRRLQLLVVLAAKPNVLLLDEPTNDLDLDTLRILEDFLDDWPGALIAVSHDRAFLERGTDRIVALDSTGSLEEVPGGLSAWLSYVGKPQRQVRRDVTAPSDTSSGGESPKGARPAKGQRIPKPVGRELRDLERRLARAIRERDLLAEKLLGMVDHRQIADLSGKLADASAEVDQLENSWLELAESAE